MISVLVFSYSETLKSMLVEYADTEMGFLNDYSDDDPNHKSIRGNGFTTFHLHVSQCRFLQNQIVLNQYLFPMHRLSIFIQG